ncbi:hypothetical protein ACFVVX_03705 [Kitasatospora sp. NPDC058170]
MAGVISVNAVELTRIADRPCGSADDVIACPNQLWPTLSCPVAAA